MTIRILAALAVASFALASPASALPLKLVDAGWEVILVRGGHGHAHGNRGRHLGWSIGRHRGWSHSRHRMY